MSILVDEGTRLCTSGITGREGTFHSLRNREYGTQVVAGVTPGKGGQDVEGIPVFNTFHAAVEQAKPGDIIVITTTSPNGDGAFGELLATSLAARGVRGLIMGAGLRDTRELREMDFPAWTAHVSAQGTVKETPGAVNVPVTLGGQTIRPGDAIVADDDGVCVVPRLDVARAATASEARIAKEDANRKQLADGGLGLDMYGLRPKLAKVDYISYAEYVRRAGEGA